MNMMIRYLPISKYCKDFGDTKSAIDKRLQRGIWVYGMQVFNIDGMRERQIDLVEVDKWKEKQKLNCRAV